MKKFFRNHPVRYFGASVVNILFERGPYVYSWEFDDGEKMTGESVTKIWYSKGIHKIICTATDIESKLVGSAELIIFVIEPANPGHNPHLGPIIKPEQL